MLLLVDGDDPAGVVEDHAPGGRGALVDRGDVLVVIWISWLLLGT